MKAKGEAPQKLGDILDEVLSEKGYYGVCREWTVVRKWPDIAGEKFARVTECKKVEDGVLYVKVASAPWRQEAAYEKNRLLERIRKEYCPTIKEIVFY